MTWRHLVARLALGAALLASLWVAFLLIHGGIETVIFGLRIKSTDPSRAMVIAFAAMLAFVASVSSDNADPVMTSVLDLWRSLSVRLDSRIIAMVLAVCVTAVGLRLGSKSAGGSDSYGYISEAELWLSGRLVMTQPWIDSVPWPGALDSFSPLGWSPGVLHNTIVPTYSAGLPMLMAGAKRLAGQCAIFWVVPLCGGIMVLATFGIARAAAGSCVGVIAAVLLATSPPFLFMLMAPMSDVPAASAWAVTFWCLTTGTLPGAVMGGLSAALAVLIRPNLAPLAAIPILWLSYRAYTDSSERRRDFRKAIGFGLACLPGIVITAVLNERWYGSPLTSGYGPLAGIFSLKGFLPNVFHYAGLLSATQTPLAFLGLMALLVPSARLWGDGAWRSLVVPMGFFVLAVFFEYCAYATFGAWWDLRFLLPTWPFMTMGMAVVWVRLTESLLGRGAVADRLLIFVSVAAVIALGFHGLQFARQGGTFEQQRWEAKYQRAGTMVSERTDANSVIFAGLYSGSVRYYAGRVTLTYFKLDADWLDRAVAWFDSQGIHPYALLEPFEIEEFKSKFSSKNRLGGLPMKPSAMIDGSTKIYFFDLHRGSDILETTETISAQPLMTRCIGPAPAPSLTLRAPAH